VIEGIPLGPEPPDSPPPEGVSLHSPPARDNPEDLSVEAIPRPGWKSPRYAVSRSLFAGPFGFDRSRAAPSSKCDFAAARNPVRDAPSKYLQASG